MPHFVLIHLLQSLVIVTRLPFVELFQQISSLLAPEFFEKGSICLEASAKEIDQWPGPIPGGMLNLPLMGTVFQVTSFYANVVQNQFILIYLLFCLAGENFLLLIPIKSDISHDVK